MKRLYSILLLASLLTMFVFSLAWAQTEDTQRIESPDFTTSSLEAELETVEASEKLTEEQKKQAKTYIETSVTSLANAAKNLENRARFTAELENAPQTLQTLRNDIDRVQTEMANAPEVDDEPMREEALLQLEQDLIAKESELRTLRSES